MHDRNVLTLDASKRHISELSIPTHLHKRRRWEPDSKMICRSRRLVDLLVKRATQKSAGVRNFAYCSSHGSLQSSFDYPILNTHTFTSLRITTAVSKYGADAFDTLQSQLGKQVSVRVGRQEAFATATSSYSMVRRPGGCCAPLLLAQ